jgi:hypothetical protein
MEYRIIITYYYRLLPITLAVVTLAHPNSLLFERSTH